MTPVQFRAWLDAMKAAGRAKTQRQIAAMLDVDPTTIGRWKEGGVTGDTAVRTLLACAALLAGIEA